MEDVFDVCYFWVGKFYIIFFKLGVEQLFYMVYEFNDYEYVVFEFFGDYKVECKECVVEMQQGFVVGKLEFFFWNVIVGQGLSYELVVKMEGVL